MSSTNFICTLIVGLPSSWLQRGFVISVTGLMAGTGIIWNNLPRLNGYFCSNLPCTSFSPHYYQPSECQMSLSYLSLHSHHQVFAFQIAQAPRGWASAALIPTAEPEYVSWSVAVFWDNSRTAILCILFTYHMLIKAAYTGSVYCWPSIPFLISPWSLHWKKFTYSWSPQSLPVNPHRFSLVISPRGSLWLSVLLLPEHHFFWIRIYVMCLHLILSSESMTTFVVLLLVTSVTLWIICVENWISRNVKLFSIVSPPWYLVLFTVRT